MNRLRTISILFLSLCVGSFFMTGTAFSQENWVAKADITENKPVIKSLPEEKIPVETVKGKKGGGGKVLLGLLGVALVSERLLTDSTQFGFFNKGIFIYNFVLMFLVLPVIYGGLDGVLNLTMWLCFFTLAGSYLYKSNPRLYN